MVRPSVVWSEIDGKEYALKGTCVIKQAQLTQTEVGRLFGGVIFRCQLLEFLFQDVGGMFMRWHQDSAELSWNFLLDNNSVHPPIAFRIKPCWLRNICTRLTPPVDITISPIC
jgi:hypothetical protein